MPVRRVCVCVYVRVFVLGASSQACQDVRGPAAARGQQKGETE